MPDDIAANALAEALYAYERAAAEVRLARADFLDTLRAAGPASAPFFERDATAEMIAGLARTLATEATSATAFSSSVFDALAYAGRPLADLRQLQARGEALALSACTCGTCEACRLSAAAVRAGHDPIAELTAAVLRALEPSSLVSASGAPMRPSNVTPLNRHGRRAQVAAQRSGSKIVQ